MLLVITRPRPSMSADHESLSNGDRLTLDMREARLFAPSMDSPRGYRLSDAYCQQCSCIASTPESASQTVYGIDYLRYWDCCGASTVAIESKIEQALDLLKNHLMFAVREEVRTLNEEVQDLLSKNEQLEYENHILRSQATPETLSRLHNLLSEFYEQKPIQS